LRKQSFGLEAQRGFPILKLEKLKWTCSSHALPLLYETFQNLSNVEHGCRYGAGDTETETGDDDPNTSGVAEMCNRQRLGSLCKEQMAALLLHWL